MPSRILLLALFAACLFLQGMPGPLHAQEPAPVATAATPAPQPEAAAPADPTVPPQVETIKPTWLTERYARTYVFKIPAPRGQIVDRNGEPLVVTRVAQNLAILFPAPQDYSDAKAVAFAREQIALAERVTGRASTVSDATIEKHYRNRGILPLDILGDLSPKHQKAIKAELAKEGKPLGEQLVFHPVYVRHYPHGSLAAHILGYTGMANPPLTSPIENNELLWPESEGREGLELTFNEQLTGKPGVMTVHFDATGKKDYEKITVPPQPGYNVVTTLNLKLQQSCEKALEKIRRGALVFLDPRTGDIHAMASRPSFDPNQFVQGISAERFNALVNDPDNPLLPRAYRSAYPPGSTFKPFVGIVAIESGAIGYNEFFPGPPELKIGNTVMHNWKKSDAGMLDLAGALEQSCNTWFYAVGIRTGANALIEGVSHFGFGRKTGIPLRSEAAGILPTQEFMLQREKRRFGDGDVANFSIGQGALQVTPLQMAQAMGVIGNSGRLNQTRLVQQVQSLDGKVVTGYGLRIRDEATIHLETMNEIKRGLTAVVSGGSGTGRRAGNDMVQVGGKTGSAQWGPERKQRIAAWFAGLVPIDNPQYACVALYESEIRQSGAHGGQVAAPLIGQVLKDVYKNEKGRRKKPKVEEPVQAEEDGD